MKKILSILVILSLAIFPATAKDMRDDYVFYGHVTFDTGCRIAYDQTATPTGAGPIRTTGEIRGGTLVVDGATSIAGTLTLAAVPVTPLDLGTASNGLATVVESGDGINHKTVITLTAVQLVVADGGFVDSATLYTFPKGHIKWEGAVLDSVATMSTTNFNASTADLYNMSVGSAESAAGDGTLTGTSVTMIPNISIDTVNGTNLVNDCDGASTSATFIDGTSTAVPVVINMGVPAANDNGANTNSISGTLTLFWKFLGDN